MTFDPLNTASTIEFSQNISIEAEPKTVFEAMIQRLTLDQNGGPGQAMFPMELERWPGGRWYRNLGDNTGHLWGFVQSFRPPSLLEIQGPMFMSYPALGHLIFRFEPTSQGTRLFFRYSALGLISEEHRLGIKTGFGSMLKDVQRLAET